MRSWSAISYLAWEIVIFIFPMVSEIGAFCCAYAIKDSGLADGSRLLLILAAVKLASSILEYKGYEEAYLGYNTGGKELFSTIGWFQLLQGIIFPLGVLAFASHVLGWNVPAPFNQLLLWVGVTTSLRQFLSYRWRVQLKIKNHMDRQTICEVALAYGTIGAIVLATLKMSSTSILLFWLDIGWMLGAILTMTVSGWLWVKNGARLFGPLSLRQWYNAVVQATASQLGKEFFIVIGTTDVVSGFIARAVVTVYGLGVVYPVAFFRLRIFDRISKSTSHDSTAFLAMDSELRRTAFLASAGLLSLSVFGSYATQATGINFPFTAALISLAIAYPIAAFDAMSYLSLLQKARRSKCTAALVAGGTSVLVLGYFIARSGLPAGLLAIAYILILGGGDFVVNKVSRALARQ